jgi:hypothetical protein
LKECELDFTRILQLVNNNPQQQFSLLKIILALVGDHAADVQAFHTWFTQEAQQKGVKHIIRWYCAMHKVY